MRRLLPSLPILLLAASCAQEPQQKSEDLQAFDVQEDSSNEVAPPAPPPASRSATSAPNAGPNVSPTAAPGVAFNYRYAFRLPAQRIAAVQEQHAQACEKLGLDRCRITGMRYRLVNERDIEAMLAFKLDPAIARQFGKQGNDAVVQAEGMLVDSEISGQDVGSEIAASTRSEAQLAEDLQRIEAQLARAGLRSPERAELQAQAEQLRQSIRSIRTVRTETRESLAKTPMVFQYGSGDLVPGFDTNSPFREAIKQAGDNLIGGLSVLLVILVSLLPWALLALLGWWVWRRVRPGRVVSPAPQAADAEGGPDAG